MTTDTLNKNKRCHMTLEGLSSVCAKLKPASSKNNEIPEINVLQKFTSHALLDNIYRRVTFYTFYESLVFIYESIQSYSHIEPPNISLQFYGINHVSLSHILQFTKFLAIRMAD